MRYSLQVLKFYYLCLWLFVCFDIDDRTDIAATNLCFEKQNQKHHKLIVVYKNTANAFNVLFRFCLQTTT